MSDKPLVSVVLGSYNRLKYLKYTLLTVREELANFPHEIIVIDGGSTDGSGRWLLKQKDTITIIQHNRGEFQGKPITRKSWGYFMNLGFKAAQGKYICMISDDCLVIPGAIKNGINLFEKETSEGHKVGAIAFYFRNWPDDKPYKVAYSVGGNLYVNHGLYLKSALEDVNYIDENNYQFYYGDSDLCLRMIEKGYKIIDSPTSFIEHFKHGNSTIRKSNSNLGKSDLDNYIARWQSKYRDVKDNNGEKEINHTDYYDTARFFRATNSARLMSLKSHIKNLLKLK